MGLYPILAQVLSLVLCLLCLTSRLALSFFPMVVADVRSLQVLAQTLLDGLALFAPCPTTQPLQLPPSRSARRRRRRQATLRKLYSATVVDRVPTEVTPSPIPTVQPLIEDEMAILLSGLPSVQLSTYDCSMSALCRTQKKRLEFDF